ncbi:MAG: translation initiation factor IF-2 subunit beta [Nanohaloarchaea archaeon]|nr:translation initiation factor IF-2 subunit beta [Candidatus Nanohaloarchaea archaeon]
MVADDYEKMLDGAYEQLPEISDNAERFEMPVLKTIVIGSRTEIVNFIAASKHIRRDEKELLKYMSKELATFGELSGAKAEFVGKFGSIAINDKFKKYVNRFVLCNECGKPDTHVVKAARQEFLKCEACGAKRPIAKS